MAKNFVSSLNGLAATIVFATQGAVLWPQTLALAAGTIGNVARIIPRNIIRVLIVVVGATLTVAFARRYWFGSERGRRLVLCASAATRAVIALSGSASASTTVKWFVPAISS